MVWHSAVFMTGSLLGVVRRRSKVVTAAPVAGSRSMRLVRNTLLPVVLMLATMTSVAGAAPAAVPGAGRGRGRERKVAHAAARPGSGS